MATNSTTAGYLSGGTGPVYDAPLDRVLHDIIQGVTGIPAPLIRPRWQPEPPIAPDITVDWVAFGNMGEKRDTFAYLKSGETQQDVVRTEDIRYQVSVYGPRCNEYAAILADGISISQNRAALAAMDAAIIECTDAMAVPMMVNGKWVKRADMNLRIRRKTTRRYNILSIDSADIVVDNESYLTAIQIEG